MYVESALEVFLETNETEFYCKKEEYKALYGGKYSPISSKSPPYSPQHGIDYFISCKAPPLCPWQYMSEWKSTSYRQYNRKCMKVCGNRVTTSDSPGSTSPHTIPSEDAMWHFFLIRKMT